MIKLNVSIEIGGKQIPAGAIIGTDPYNARFSYSEHYIDDIGVPISKSLPLQASAFSSMQTRNYFEGLLPEGFTRRFVAQMLRADPDDYLSVLAGLGRECIGAIRISEEGTPDEAPSYEALSLDQVRALAREGATESSQLVVKAHLSLAGASGKVGLYHDSKTDKWFLPHGTAPSTHIVKQSHVRFSGIVTNEQLVMRTAAGLGMDVAVTSIISTGGHDDGDVLFATERYDRIFTGIARPVSGFEAPLRMHQEDMAQALGIPSAQKYERRGESHLKLMADALRRYSSDPVTDLKRLWDAVVFDYLVGNTDAHVKNFSLLYTTDLRGVRLAPLYDMVSTTVYGESTRDMAFGIGGRYRLEELDRDSFKAAAKDAGLGEKLAMRRFDELRDTVIPALDAAAEELSAQGFEKAGELRDKIVKTGGIAYC